MKMNDRSRSLWYFALPVLLLAACVFQPSLARAQMTSMGVDCAQINVASLMMQDNMRAGRILIECGILQGGQPAAGSATHKPAAPPNIRVSNASGCNSSGDLCGSESMVAASTADKGQTIVVNYNANGSFNGGNYGAQSYSTDGGKTFTEIFPFEDNSHGANYGDPIVVFNSKLGEFFAGDLVSGCGGQGVGLWTSTDGKTWKVGACAHNGSFDDRESMWADNEPTSGTYGRMYISWNDYTTSCGAGGCLFVTYSDDGASWSTPLQLNNNGIFYRDVQVTGSPRGATLIGTNSTVFIASMDEGGGGSSTRQNLMFSSTDGGKTWKQVTMGPRYNPVGDQSCGYFYQVNPIIRHMGWGEPAVGPNGVVHYVYSGAGKKGDHGDIFYQQSTDNGKTWSKAMKLNTDKDAPNKTQWMPSLSATSDGNVTASWYDRRKATSACNNVGDPGCNYERVGRQSNTNGASWSKDITISTHIITQPAQDDGGVVGCYAGDYDYNVALNAADAGNATGSAYITWTDGRKKIGGVPVQNVDFATTPEP
jgi:hypothetical protein